MALRKYIFIFAFFILQVQQIYADNNGHNICDSIVSDSTQLPVKKYGKHLKNNFLDRLYDIVKDFSRIDTNYIEPQHYNYAFMIQNTNTYEIYKLRTGKNMTVTFNPDLSVKFGPYFGWRWIFLGYTLDISHVGGSNNKHEFDVSLYSNQIGLDVFYRTSGDDYHISNLSLEKGYNTSNIDGAPFSGIKSGIKGFSLYYITNHHKFSYPAAYSQSTCQRISAGSLLFGIGYTSQKLSVDWEALAETMNKYLGKELTESVFDSSLVKGEVNYDDLSLQFGYGYNWVFARNCLFNASLSLALAYKHSSGDSDHKNFTFRDFNFDNFNIDGVTRFGIVWNNTKWYIGSSAILHAYNYHKSNFYTNSVFGSLNFYIGFNFGHKKS
ncbi:MAG: DUF4421 domain-containing protein [Prevotella sp.]|nr:DUF4421 domain-containing protein [Prevotella sp.]MBP7097317.1 DUF4421 domain-containing protein [Prevotella sp.]MBP8686460.1 DUF4421 domain-containing protein [Prevotella sp.]MBP9981794.1 DUF4421 domain-containing protein [Prevotella sp.]